LPSAKKILFIALAAATTIGLSAAGCGDDSTDDLFPPPPPPNPLEVQPAPGGLRRLTVNQLKNSLDDLIGSENVALMQLPDHAPVHGYYSIDAAENAYATTDITAFESSFTAAVDNLLTNLTPVEKYAPCVAAPTDACYEEVARKFGRSAWRRPMTDDEVATLVSLGNEGKTWGMGDFDTGLKYELLAILQSSNMLYITEIGEPGDPSGYRKLTQYELASRMSFFLQDRAPDPTLLDVADQGKLATDEDIRAQADRMLETPEARSALAEFYGQAFLLDTITSETKDPSKFPQFGAPLVAAMKQSVLAFVDDIVFTRDADAREIFTSQNYFVNADLAPLYGMSVAGTSMQKVTIPADQKRAGILGQAGFLAHFAHASISSPTRRGRFVQENLLCNDLPAPPPGQNTNIPPDPPGMPQTMKQKLTAHEADASCATCHQRMDPIGFALENFDAIGAFRATDNGLTLDTTGHVVELGDFASAVDLGNALAASDDAMKCVVKNFIRSSMGHLESKGETEAIAALAKSFADGGYHMKSLMAELCLSPAFKLVDEPK